MIRTIYSAYNGTVERKKEATMVIKKPEWVKNLEEERQALTESLKQLEGLSVEYENALKRIEFINNILVDAGYLKRHKGVSDDTKAVIGSSLLQSFWYSFNSEVLGRIMRIDPFHIKAKLRN